MKIFGWIQYEVPHILSDIDRWIIETTKKDFISSFDTVLFKGTPIETMPNFLNKYHPDILIAGEEYGGALSSNFGYPVVILPPKVDILEGVFKNKMWKDVGINPPFSILIRGKRKAYVYKKSLIITDDLEKSAIDIIKDEGFSELD